jgi:hypothetical protein
LIGGRVTSGHRGQGGDLGCDIAQLRIVSASLLRANDMAFSININYCGMTIRTPSRHEDGFKVSVKARSRSGLSQSASDHQSKEESD